MTLTNLVMFLVGGFIGYRYGWPAGAKYVVDQMAAALGMKKVDHDA